MISNRFCHLSNFLFPSSNMKVSKLWLCMYSYTSILSSSAMQQPSSLTRFLC
uniref:Uncharacterized protein n=1 Tax=Arundo donax TaxID=35708 RepID=A0A0A9GVH9_ARUDO